MNKEKYNELCLLIAKNLQDMTPIQRQYIIETIASKYCLYCGESFSDCISKRCPS